MTLAQLAKRSGVSMPAVVRILHGAVENAKLRSITGLAAALGLKVRFESTDTALEMRRQEAEKKAREIVGLMQGTSGLEDEGIGLEAFEEAVEQTMHELMAGQGKKLWGPI